MNTRHLRNRTAALAILCSVGLGLSGCSTLYNDADQFETFVTSPKTAATVAVLAKTTVVVICDISAVAQITSTVEQAVSADQSTLGTTNKIYAGSSAACTGLGGLVSGTTTVPTGTVVVATPAAS